jgi:hypothetical protein
MLFYNFLSLYHVFDCVFIGVVVGFWSFLMEKTDFVYEYLKELVKILPRRIKARITPLLEYYENSGGDYGDNFLTFLGNFQGRRPGAPGFLSRLLSCFYCRTTALSIILSVICLNPLFLLTPFFAILIGKILFKLGD